jgi:hypothetical protein
MLFSGISNQSLNNISREKEIVSERSFVFFFFFCSDGNKRESEI